MKRMVDSYDTYTKRKAHSLNKWYWTTFHLYQNFLLKPYQLLEYQTDMRRCRFDTLGKQTSAHLAGGPTPYKGWVPPAWWVSAGAASPGPPTARVGLQPSRTVGGVHPPCGRDISPPAQWVDLFPAHNSVGLLLIEFSQESGWLLYCNDISVEQWARLCNSHF